MFNFLLSENLLFCYNIIGQNFHIIYLMVQILFILCASRFMESDLTSSQLNSLFSGEAVFNLYVNKTANSCTYRFHGNKFSTSVEELTTLYLCGKGGGMYLPSKSELYLVLYMWLKENGLNVGR